MRRGACDGRGRMKKLYFGCNLKMNKTPTETELYLQELQKKTKHLSREEVELFLLPSFVCLERAMRIAGQESVRIGAQTLYWEEDGPYTGENSARMLEDLGLTMVMIGHSERRTLFGETDAEEAKRVQTALQHGLIAMLCIGETAEEKEMDVTEDVLREQLKVGLSSATQETLQQIRIVYEPVWSDEENEPGVSEEAVGHTLGTIRKILRELFGEAADEIPILYGGDIHEENIGELAKLPAVDGFLDGNADRQPEELGRLIHAALSKLKEA